MIAEPIKASSSYANHFLLNPQVASPLFAATVAVAGSLQLYQKDQSTTHCF